MDPGGGPWAEIPRVGCPGGGQSARLCAMGTILEADLVNVFLMNVTTVLGKWPK